MPKGRRAVVTGSTSGIGLGIAKALSQQGCAVMLNGFGEADAIEPLHRHGVADLVTLFFDLPEEMVERGEKVGINRDHERTICAAMRRFRGWLQSSETSPENLDDRLRKAGILADESSADRVMARLQARQQGANQA